MSSGFGVVDFGWRFWVSAFGLRCLLSGFDSVVCGTDTDWCLYGYALMLWLLLIVVLVCVGVGLVGCLLLLLVLFVVAGMCCLGLRG